MELKAFQGLALRTETQIQGIKLNRNNLITLLKVVIAVAEILDGVKKAVYYNKTSKLETDFISHLRTLSQLIEALTWQSSGRGPLGSVMNQNETISNVDPRVFHGILGILTESGELASALLKVVDDPNASLDAVNIQEEMSDIAWYKAILHDALKLDWDQGLENVINKLRIRYPDKYSDESADVRDLDAERAALEVGFNLQDVRPIAENPITLDDLVSTIPLKPNVGETFVISPMDSTKYLSGQIGSDYCSANLSSLNTSSPLVNTDHRMFSIHVPEGTTDEQLEEIIDGLRNRVRYVDGYKAV